MISSILFSFFFLQSICFGQYYSQCGQDKYVYETFFKNKEKGVFLDIGAHDGISLSNTYFFEKELNWTGICLEPNPTVFQLLKKNRKCITCAGCATSEHGIFKHYLKINGPLEMLSGLLDKFDPQHKDRIERQLKEYGGSYQIIDVPCYNLNKLLEDAGIAHIDFLSVDTEGGEYEILKNFNFSKYHVNVIAVEDNYGIYPFSDLMHQRGFHKMTSLHQDLIFVNNKFRK